MVLAAGFAFRRLISDGPPGELDGIFRLVYSMIFKDCLPLGVGVGVGVFVAVAIAVVFVVPVLLLSLFVLTLAADSDRFDA